MKPDLGLKILLELHGTEYTEENGYWYRIEAWQVPPSASIPHGIRYNLTLHDNRNTRLFGFDNAHAVAGYPSGKFGVASRKFAGRMSGYDHVHESSNDKGKPYVFSSPEQLLQDFFAAVDRKLRQLTP
jgi:Family of unknown function (DUF6516)